METRVRTLRKSRLRNPATSAPQLENVNWFLNADTARHAMSEVNEKPKVSRKYDQCIGVAVVGTDAKTHKPISFLTHQAPGVVLSDHLARDFEEDFKRRLFDLKKRSKPGSIAVRIFGGQTVRRAHNPENIPADELEPYPKMVAQVIIIAKRIVGQGVKVARGPSHNLIDPQHVVLDTKRRRLHIFAPRQPRFWFKW
ncbi:MAG: hypothetical protein AAB573_03835 [Patescibacteria group bacterium]